MDHVDHEQGEVGRIVHGSLLDIHKVLEAPILLGIAEIELDLEAQAVIIDKLRVPQVQIAAKEHDMGAFVGLEGCFHDDDDIERLRKLLVQHLDLVHVGLDMVFDTTLFQVATWNVGSIQFAPVLATPTCTGIGPLVREIEGGVMA